MVARSWRFVLSGCVAFLLLGLSSRAQADHFPTQAEYNANLNRIEALKKYREAAAAKDPEIALTALFQALEFVDRAGKFTVYRFKFVRQGTRRRYKFYQPTEHEYQPFIALWKRYSEVLDSSIKSASSLAVPRDRKLVEAQFARPFELLDRFTALEMAGTEIEARRNTIESKIVELSRPPMKVEPDSKTDTSKTGETGKAQAGESKPSDKKTEDGKKPVVGESGKPDEKADGKTEVKTEEVLTLELQLTLSNLRQANRALRQQLQQGDISSAVVSAKKAEKAAEKLDKIEARFAQRKIELKNWQQLAEGVELQQRLSCAVVALEAVKKVQQVGQFDERARQTFQIGLKTAQAVDARAWVVALQQQHALALSEAYGNNKVSRDAVRDWQQVFNEPITIKILSLALSGSEALGQQDWAIPQRKTKDVKDEKAAEEAYLAKLSHYALAHSLRSRSLAQQCFHERKLNLAPETRDLALLDLLNRYERGLQVFAKRGLSEGHKLALAQSQKLLRDEIVAMPYCLLRQDHGEVQTRIALLLQRLPRMRRVLKSSDLAQVLLGIGLGSQKQLGAKHGQWLIDEAVKLDPNVGTKVLKVFDDQLLREWTSQQAARNKGA